MGNETTTVVSNTLAVPSAGAQVLSSAAAALNAPTNATVTPGTGTVSGVPIPLAPPALNPSPSAPAPMSTVGSEPPSSPMPPPSLPTADESYVQRLEDKIARIHQVVDEWFEEHFSIAKITGERVDAKKWEQDRVAGAVSQLKDKLAS